MDSLSLTLGALADPTRRAILARLADGDASVAELATPFNMSVRAVSKHVAVLEKAGLVTRSRDAQRRLSTLRLDPLTDLDQWLAAYRRIWEERHDNIAALLRTVQDGKAS